MTYHIVLCALKVDVSNPVVAVDANARHGHCTSTPPVQLTFEVPCCLPDPQLYFGRTLGIASLDFDISEEWDVILVGQGLVQRSHAIFEAAEGIINDASVGD